MDDRCNERMDKDAGGRGMSAGAGNTIRVRHRKVSKPYVIKVNEQSGKVYLEREKHPLLVELPYILMLMFAVVFATLSCMQYIHLKTEMECRIRETQALESQLFTLRNDNILAEKDTSYIHDLSMIYEIATESLDMVPVAEANVVFYQRSNSEYVYQKDNIPSIGLP